MDFKNLVSFKDKKHPLQCNGCSFFEISLQCRAGVQQLLLS